MRSVFVAFLLGAIAVACSAKSNDSNPTPTGTSSSSGGPTGITTCTGGTGDGGSGPVTGKARADLALAGPPCPIGYAAAPHQHVAGSAFAPDVGPVRTFGSAAELAASSFCVRTNDAGTVVDLDAGDGGDDAGEAGAGDAGGGGGFDFATQDVVAISYLAYAASTAPPLTDTGSELYAQRTLTWCSSTEPTATDWFYAVPKGTAVKARDCRTSCSISSSP